MKKVVLLFYDIFGLLLMWPVKLYQYVEDELDWDDSTSIIATIVLQFAWVAVLIWIIALVIG